MPQHNPKLGGLRIQQTYFTADNQTRSNFNFDYLLLHGNSRIELIIYRLPYVDNHTAQMKMNHHENIEECRIQIQKYLSVEPMNRRKFMCI